MAIAFSSKDEEIIKQKIVLPPLQNDTSFSFDELYEITKCVNWIEANNLSKIALQFPDYLLKDATNVSLKLEEITHKEIFVLGDTSYGSCCVDEIATEHVLAEGIIHFGHACLSPTKRLPVLYIFGKQHIEIKDVCKEFRKHFDLKSHVIILYDVSYSYCIKNIYENLQEYENLIISTLQIPGETTSSSNINDNYIEIMKCRRFFHIPKTKSLNDYALFYIGSQNQTIMNFMLAFNNLKFFSYNPLFDSAQSKTLDINKYLRKRYYYIEKTKDANIIGILVGTLGVSDYLTIIKHLKEIIKEAGKKSYTIAVGKLNSAKLANFPEIEIFVHVACAESSLIDSSDFYQPIITPYELEIACNQARKWTGDYITDFSELLPGAKNYLSPKEIEKINGDVSLITGKMRFSSLDDNFEDVSESALMPRNEMKLSTIHAQAAGEYLAGRSWQGLEQRLGETPVSEITEGKKGIASGYEEEEELCDKKHNY